MQLPDKYFRNLTIEGVPSIASIYETNYGDTMSHIAQ